MSDPADARRRAEEALVFMDAALRDDMPPLPSQVRWLADAVRALLAAVPSDRARMTARAKPDPLGVECPYCSAVALVECFRYDRRSGDRWGHRAPHAARGRRAESAEKREKRGDAVRQAAEMLRSVLRVREQRSWCGSLACDAIYHEAEKLLAALRATASPAPGSEEVREAEAVLAEAREALDEIRRRSTDKLAGGIAASFLGAHPRAALRGGQKGWE